MVMHMCDKDMVPGQTVQSYLYRVINEFDIWQQTSQGPNDLCLKQVCSKEDKAKSIKNNTGSQEDHPKCLSPSRDVYSTV